MFQGFPRETIPFFLELRFHNDKSFMDANRERYIRDVREPFYDFILDLGQKMLFIDPDFEVRPHKCLSRINRDTRFSKDKSPYRDGRLRILRRRPYSASENRNLPHHRAERYSSKIP